MVHKTFLLAIVNFPTHERELSAWLHLSKVIPVIDLDLPHVFLVLVPLYRIVHANNGQIIWLAVWLTTPTDVRAETEADVNKIRLKNRQLLITTLELHPRSTCLFLRVRWSQVLSKWRGLLQLLHTVSSETYR